MRHTFNPICFRRVNKTLEARWYLIIPNNIWLYLWGHFLNLFSFLVISLRKLRIADIINIFINDLSDEVTTWESLANQKKKKKKKWIIGMLHLRAEIGSDRKYSVISFLLASHATTRSIVLIVCKANRVSTMNIIRFSLYVEVKLKK